MKFNTKVTSAVVLGLLSAGTASASLQQFGTGDSSLTFIGLDATNNISVLIDLDYNLDNFTPTSGLAAPGTSIIWNFGSNTRSVNGGAAQNNGYSWSAPFAAFTGPAASATVQWAVIAGDSTAGGADRLRFLTTGNPTAAQISNSPVTGQTLGASSSMTNVNALYSSNNLIGTHNAAGVNAGASTATNSEPSAYVGGPNFGTAGNWIGGLRWASFAGDDQSTRFSYIYVEPRPGTTQVPVITQFGLPNLNAPTLIDPASASAFSFDLDTGTLVWTTPVPEPSTYLLMFAGLLAVGAVAKRRSA